MEKQRVALVTGANRGIGFEAVNQLASLGMDVILTARDEKRGREAARKLNKKNVVFCQLDVTDKRNIAKARGFVEKEFGRLDILVNNAGILLDMDDSIMSVDPEKITRTITTNTLGPLLVSREFMPLMKRGGYGRIVNVSSGSGQLVDMGDWAPAYSISKTALNAVTRLLAGGLEGTNILVNSVCPGWVRTDMGGKDAERSVEKGAETIIWLATLPDGGPTGGFFRDKKKISW